MLEPLSAPLLKLLLESGLCSASDLRRCRGRVRQMAYDLPAFDSVWLDALVQSRRLTPFQARILESPQPQRIRVGPCVLVNRLGGGPLGETFIARPRMGHELCVTKILLVSDRLSVEGLDRLNQLVRAASAFRHPSVVVPHTCDRIGGQLVLVSRYIPGPHLGELLVRRGRYPAAVVWEIGRQLVEGLATLEELGLFHGDIRVANVRLTTAGVAVLVDGGVRTALDPELTVHVGLPPERYDGIAAELIGTGRLPNAASDLYALGCLLWQLLAGRPPFPGGDPLGKLAAHQTRTVDDVRKWAPDTPPPLAEAIRRFTARDAAARPAHFSDVLRQWGAPRRSGQRTVAAFRRRFESSSGGTPRAGRASAALRWSFLLATLFTVSGAAVTLANKGARNELLSIAHRITATWQQARDALRGGSPEPFGPDASRPAQEPAVHQSTTGQPSGSEPVLRASPPGIALPAPNQQGLILLDTPGPYEVAEVSFVGRLVIRGKKSLHPVISIGEQPLKIWAESVRLENVQLNFVPKPNAAATGREALATIEAQNLDVEGCSFQSPCQAMQPSPPGGASNTRAGSARAAPGPTSLAWRFDPHDPRGGNCTIRNSVFIGDGPAFHVGSAPRQIACRNALKIGAGPLIQLAAAPRTGQSVLFKLAQTTCRHGGALLRWKVPAGWNSKGQVVIEASDCVFDVAAETGALFELVGASPRAELLQALQMTGEGSLAATGPDIAVWIGGADGKVSPLDPRELRLEGISTGAFQFAGPLSSDPAASEVHASEAPRRSAQPPGISARELNLP